jgi:hypothetical protein
VGQGLFDLVDQDQAQVARLQAVQCHVDGLEFAGDLVDALGARASARPSRSRAITSPSSRPRWQASW